MTLTEAITTGKKIRRKSWHPDKWIKSSGGLNLVRDDVLATDWEVPEKKVTVTREQLIEAYRNALARVTNLDSYKRIDHVNTMAEELGL